MTNGNHPKEAVKTTGTKTGEAENDEGRDAKKKIAGK